MLHDKRNGNTPWGSALARSGCPSAAGASWCSRVTCSSASRSGRTSPRRSCLPTPRASCSTTTGPVACASSRTASSDRASRCGSRRFDAQDSRGLEEARGEEEGAGQTQSQGESEAPIGLVLQKLPSISIRVTRPCTTRISATAALRAGADRPGVRPGGVRDR